MRKELEQPPVSNLSRPYRQNAPNCDHRHSKAPSGLGTVVFGEDDKSASAGVGFRKGNQRPHFNWYPA
jgi:hypothetical protein